MPADAPDSYLGIAAIVLMGLATYATRAGGFWLIQRLRPSRFLEAWLAQIPGAVFAALCAPLVLNSGPAGWGAALLTLVLARATGNFLVAMAAGVAGVAILRLI
ncbi:AzlD family protein [Skermanella pratensis]|uniref:AzlD family protein n=1 Tax=Skermanella pratensis TaxID=2233999 RepID=UPI0013018021|nr:AzlD domain-containing protein [Skermanella pratensis]